MLCDKYCVLSVVICLCQKLIECGIEKSEYILIDTNNKNKNSFLVIFR